MCTWCTCNILYIDLDAFKVQQLSARVQDLRLGLSRWETRTDQWSSRILWKGGMDRDGSEWKELSGLCKMSRMKLDMKWSSWCTSMGLNDFTTLPYISLHFYLSSSSVSIYLTISARSSPQSGAMCFLNSFSSMDSMMHSFGIFWLA